MAVYDNSVLVFTKRVKVIFASLKKLNALNQYKAIKYIERHLISVKRYVRMPKKYNLYKRRVKLLPKTNLRKSSHHIGSIHESFSKYTDKLETDAINCNIQDIEIDEINLCHNFDISAEYSNIETKSENQYYEESLPDDSNEIASEKNQEYTIKVIDKSNVKKKFVCIICKKPMKSHHSLIDHIFKHAGTQQSCLKCRTSFKNATAYKCHLLNNFCDSGGFKYNTDTFNTLSIKQILFCPYCGQGYSKLCNLRRHLNNCKFSCEINDVPIDKIKCNICQLQFHSKDECDIHYMKHFKNQCQKCNMCFKSRKLLREHNAIHKKTSSTTYSCGACILTFRTRSLYRDHMRIFKNDKSHIEHTKASKPASEQIWCKICVKSFVDMKTYKQHCLRQHLTKPFICDKCGLTFKNKNGLTGHLIRMHKKKAPLACELCTYSTTTTYNMTRHSQIHHKQGVRKYVCDKCPKLFGTSYGLKDHLATVHSLERPYSCNMCTHVFKLRSQLKRHKVIHNPTVPYPCRYCAMGFRRYVHLERHLVSKHDEHIQNNLHISDYNKMHKVNADRRKKSKTPPPQTTMSEIPNVPEEQMFSLIDVQSGELVLLSVNDMSKNNVINMTAESDLLNDVHIPVLWNNTEPQLYSINPILQDDRNAQPTFMMPTSSEDPQLADASKNIIPEYVPHYVHNGKNIEMLANEFDIVKENILSQNNLNSDIIVTNQSFSECVNFCSIVMDE
ncbi:uncharacterized protein LOC143913845 [Arctopsyche grandis]|uniref:uncharacterized protein LOC143913845 n=1 Tax=Arctopsyche grandis TaxID=121162 RepID=UPI00406D6B6A